MASGVAFLPTNLDDAQKPLGTYKPQNTDVIRTMLREQQKECQVLHGSPLFKEFRGEGTVKQNKFGKGYAITSDVNAPAFDDCQAEGQSRMFDLIRNTAMKDEKPMRGVWAPFGKPYECLGDPSEPSSSLPKLFRDELAAERDSKRDNGKGNNRKTAKISRDMGAGGGAVGGPGGPNGGAGGGGSGSGPPGAAARIASQAAAGSKAAEADRAALEALEDELTGRRKAAMRFGPTERQEARFPEEPLLVATDRRHRSQAQPGAFVSKAGADKDIENPAVAYGQLPLPRQGLAPLRLPDGSPAITAASRRAMAAGGTGGGTGNGGTCGGDGSDASSFFVTQSAGAGSGPSDRGEEEGRGRRSDGYTGVGRPATSTPDAITTSGTLLPESTSSPAPSYQAVCDMAVPPRGQDANPVYKWHNTFVQVRQDGRKDLQQALWERSEGRRHARLSGAMAATLSTAIMGDLSLSQGRALGYPILGVPPANPYTKMEVNYAAGLEGAKVKAKAANTLEPDELRILQRFYDQLCALVEQQRMSDPISLMVIHKVKALLEAGTFLHKPMLVSVVDHVARFTRGCGLVRYNKYLLSILTFISKCAGCQEAELEEVVAEFEVAEVVYGTPVPPSRMTPELMAQVQAQQAQRAAEQALKQQAAAAAARAEANAQEREGTPNGGTRAKGAAKPFGRAMQHPAVIAALAAPIDSPDGTSASGTGGMGGSSGGGATLDGAPSSVLPALSGTGGGTPVPQASSALLNGTSGGGTSPSGLGGSPGPTRTNTPPQVSLASQVPTGGGVIGEGGQDNMATS